jgi:DNA-binding NtrC family response regulator
LRERREDVQALAQYFVARFAAEENKPISGFTHDALALLDAYGWPGNVRQLENTIFRAVVLCDTDALEVADFPQIASAVGVPAENRVPSGMAQAAPAMRAATSRADSPYAILGTDAAGHMRRLEEVEAEIIRMAIGRYEGRMSEVARRLGIGRSTLYRKLKECGLEMAEDGEDEDDLPEAKRVSA